MDLFKIYKTLQKHNSISIPKKNIFVMIEPGKFIVSEFSVTTQIISIKKYVEKFMNKQKFDLIYNGITLNNNLYLSDLCCNNQNIKRLFFKVVKKNNKKKIIEKYQKDIINYEENNKKLNLELNNLKKENDDKEYSNKISEEKCNNINTIYLKQRDEIDKLKQKLRQINDDINTIFIKEKKEEKNKRNYSMENSGNIYIKNDNNNCFKKSNSIIYSINGNNIHSRNLKIVKK